MCWGIGERDRKEVAMNLSGKTAVVTGAARGIGRAYCERLAAEGANVVVIDKSNAEALQEVASSLRGAGKMLGITADVSEPDRSRPLVRSSSSALAAATFLLTTLRGCRCWTFSRLPAKPGAKCRPRT
jgi:NAD(P)-dependent dehydrogenase (short-subunit alcohol dehydrogenase family)